MTEGRFFCHLFPPRTPLVIGIEGRIAASALPGLLARTNQAAHVIPSEAKNPFLFISYICLK